MEKKEIMTNNTEIAKQGKKYAAIMLLLALLVFASQRYFFTNHFYNIGIIVNLIIGGIMLFYTFRHYTLLNLANHHRKELFGFVLGIMSMGYLLLFWWAIQMFLHYFNIV
ncbi:MAG: hypothetical protein NZ551_08810 [Microscillaceae bacterium]|nr:hypothetical protein [Microscillaceae bacterium]MDW8461300.1 hypothetical protein [Cytophagales bacterium]